MDTNNENRVPRITVEYAYFFANEDELYPSKFPTIHPEVILRPYDNSEPIRIMLRIIVPHANWLIPRNPA